MILKKENYKTIFFQAILVLQCIGFFHEGRLNTVNSLSSDLWNIIPMAAKLNNPDLFQGDLFAGDVENFRYYIPSFVYPLSWVGKWTSDYVVAINWMHLSIHIVYSLLWFYMFQVLTRNNTVSFIFTLLSKGILWPPGNELWGIAGAWTFLPRTVFSAFLPLSILALLKGMNQVLEKRVILLIMFSGLILGITANMHPISGLVVALGLGMALFIQEIFYNRQFKRAFLYTSLFLIMFGLGLSHFIALYIENNAKLNEVVYADFVQAMKLRIGDEFLFPMSLYKKWMRIEWLLLIIIPMLLLLIYWKKLDESKKRNALFFGSFGLTLLIIPVFIFIIENTMNTLTGSTFNFSFQLVRGAKYVILAVWTLLALICAQIINSSVKSNLIVVSFILVTVLSRFEFTGAYQQKMPDLIRSQIPDLKGLVPLSREKSFHQEEDSLLRFVNENLPEDAIIIGPSFLRAGCLRSIAVDHKGASILIEGNPSKFVEWSKDIQILTSKDLDAILNLAKVKNADCLIISEKIAPSTEFKKFGYSIIYL